MSIIISLDSLGGSVVKNPPANAGDLGSFPGSGRYTGGGNGNPLQYSCLENPMNRGAWRATVRGVLRVRHDLATQHMFYLYKVSSKFISSLLIFSQCSLLISTRHLFKISYYYFFSTFWLFQEFFNNIFEIIFLRGHNSELFLSFCSGFYLSFYSSTYLSICLPVNYLYFILSIHSYGLLFSICDRLFLHFFCF